MESLRLEKTTEFVQSNHQPISTTSLSATCPRFLSSSRDSDCHFPGQPVAVLCISLRVVFMWCFALLTSSPLLYRSVI